MPYSVTYKELVISGAKIVNCSHFFPMTLPEFMEKTGFVSYGYSKSVKLAVFCYWKAEVGGYFPPYFGGAWILSSLWPTFGTLFASS